GRGTGAGRNRRGGAGRGPLMRIASPARWRCFLAVLACCALVACAPRCDRAAGLQAMRYDMLRLEQEAGAAAKGDAQALAALALRRDRVDARLVALAQPEHSDWIGRLHTDSDASKPVLQAAQRWSERRQHV